jgi:D-lyxose ketol-isomerase
LEERDTGRGQTYAEKLLFVGVGQETPFHLHREKTEDIINRAGGRLVVEVHPGGRGADGALILGDGDTNTLVDGLETTLPAGSRVVLEPGQSIQVPRGTVHRFWAEGAPVLGGEVSGVNDDLADNRFVEATARYPEVEEDCAARFLLVSEYRHVLEDDMRPGRKTR